MFKIEYRAVIKFLTKEGVTPMNIKERLDGVYRDKSPSYSTVKEWAKLFKMDRESLKYDSCSRRPEEAVTPETIELVELELLNDRRLKTKKMTFLVGVLTP
jgi:transposase